MIKFMENINLKNDDEIKIPDALLIRPKLVAVFDNIKDTINIMTSIYTQILILMQRQLSIKRINILIKISKN